MNSKDRIADYKSTHIVRGTGGMTLRDMEVLGIASEYPEEYEKMDKVIRQVKLTELQKTAKKFSEERATHYAKRGTKEVQERRNVGSLPF